MWTCSKCGRKFRKSNQPHSCKKVPLEKHFARKELAKELFDSLVKRIEANIGKVEIISIPCCVHLFGEYDFIAALPRKDGLEVRFALDRELKGKRITTCVPLSSKTFKNCLRVNSAEEIDAELLGWLKESYYLKA